MNASAFYEAATGPQFGDEINLQLAYKGDDPAKTFSIEAIDNLADQFRDFMLARVYAWWKKTGEPPHDLFAHVKLSPLSLPQHTLEFGPPWSAWTDEGGLTTVDAIHRAASVKRGDS